MRAKRSKGGVDSVIPISQSVIDGLKDITQDDPFGAIWRFVNAPDFSHQMAAVREVGKILKTNTVDSCSEEVLGVLAHAYLQCRPKHPVKRALASCLQGVHTSLQNKARNVLRNHVLSLLAEADHVSGPHNIRPVIDNLNSLMDNFVTGEQCLGDTWQEALTFLCHCLKQFYKDTRESSTPVSLTEAMHNCHVTVQVWNKLLTRAGSRIAHVTAISTETDTGAAVLTGCLDTTWKILLDDSFLMDCRAACGMTLPLILKVTAGEKIVQQVVRELFPHYGPVDDNGVVHRLLGDHDADVGTMSRLCVCSGTLAMLDVADLCVEYREGKMLLTDILGPELLTLLDRVSETNGRLLASRSIIQWLSKAILALEQSSEYSQKALRSSLHGNGKIPQHLLEYAWNHWEDAIDVIRHQARIIFEKLLTCHLLATNEEPSKSLFILGLTESLLATGLQQRGQYGPLCCLVGHLGAGTVLQRTPTLPQDLLGVMADQALAGYVSELFDKLCTRHQEELGLARKADQLSQRVPSDELVQRAASDKEQSAPPDSEPDPRNLSTWHHTWVDPMLHALCLGIKHQTTHIIEYILPRLLKCSPGSLAYMTAQLSSKCNRGAKLGALVTCLKRAKMMGILQGDPASDPQTSADVTTAVRDGQWNNVVPVKVLKEALCHENEQVRLDAFGLICENLKTTEVLSTTDMSLVRFFLPLNMSSQTPAFRQHLIAFLKKLFIRLRHGRQALVRRAQAGDTDAQAHLHHYKEFLSWLVSCAFNHVHLGAAFPSRTTALSALVMLVNVMATNKPQADCEFSLAAEMSPDRVQTLLECLNDPFEQNKMDAFTLLRSLPPEDLTLQDPDRLAQLFRAALDLASSTRPQDCTTAAYLLRVLLTQPQLLQTAHKLLQEKSNSGVNGPKNITRNLARMTEQCILTGKQDGPHIPLAAGVNRSERPLAEIQTAERHLVVLQVLLSQLQSQLSVAKKSLIHAAATAPLYPTMHCIRYILTDVDLSEHRKDPRWRHLVGDLLTISIKVAEVVSPVVSNSSPEGNVPLGPGLALDAVIQTAEDQALLRDATESAKTVNLMPEYLVVCCWRSIKECSLLLGQLTMTAPLIDSSRDVNDGLLDIEQIHALGAYFTTQLLESRHRGAFELAYAGFVQMTDVLWRCPLPEVQALPEQWLAEILDDIKSHDPGNRLCSTRRSAGVPFYVQALVSTEPVTMGRTCFKHLVTELLKLATPTQVQPGHEDTAQVHSLNVLRALYRDTRLGEDVFPFIADGLRASILGYSSQLWAIRNSATLLFGALMTRIFGVKRSKDETSRKNCLTGRVFFNRFPSLYQFLLDQLEAATTNIGCSGQYQLHPGLYPVLMVLGRLYPSVVEGSDTTLNMAAFLPHVMRCASSPVHKTRIMAARAIRPLVGKDHIKAVLVSLLERLPKDTSEATSHNMLHGVLLQVKEILVGIDGPMLQEVYHTVMPALKDVGWLLTDDNPCLVTRKAYAELVQTVISIFSSREIVGSQQMVDVQSHVIGQYRSQLIVTSTDPSTPGLSEYHQLLARNLLSSLRHQEAALSPPDRCCRRVAVDAVDVVVNLLRSPMYEVRLEALQFLHTTLDVHKCGDNNEQDAENNDMFKTSVKNTEIEMRETLRTEAIFSQLVTMVMDETHPECLSKVLEVLYDHPLSGQGVWTDTRGAQFTPLQIMEHLSHFKCSSRDNLLCAVHALSGRMVPHLYTAAAKGRTQEEAALQAWCVELEQRCSTQESALSRLTTATTLADTGLLILLDPHRVLGRRVFGVWTVLVRLLQDEDGTVRDRAAAVVHHIDIDLDLDLHADRKDLNTATVGQTQPTLALSTALTHMVALYAERDWRGVLDVLLSWIQTDLEPDWPEEDKQVRLFDKGEMNTYRDEVNFIKVAAEHLRTFIITTVTHPSQLPGNHSNRVAKEIPDSSRFSLDMFVVPNVDKVINVARVVVLHGKMAEISAELTKRISQIDQVDGSTPFMHTAEYQNTVVTLTRLSLALLCLSSTDQVLPGGGPHATGMLHDELWTTFCSNHAVPNELLAGRIKSLAMPQGS